MAVPGRTGVPHRISLQAAALDRARERLMAAYEAVLRHSQQVPVSSQRTPGGGY